MTISRTMLLILIVSLTMTFTACNPFVSDTESPEGVPPGAENGAIVTPDPDDVDIVPTTGVAEPRVEPDANDLPTTPLSDTEGYPPLEGTATP